MSGPGDVSPEILRRLRMICRALPEAYEQPAWIGIRWRIRQRTFAHVYAPDPASNSLYARSPEAGAEPTVVTFRVPLDELLAVTAAGFPYFRAAWGQNVVAAFLGEHTDWTEMAELITDSFCWMAPKYLAAEVAPPA